MTAVSNCYSRALLARKFFKFHCQHPSELRFAFRCYCSEETENNPDGNCGDDEELEGVAKPSSSNKTKKAKSLARLINSKSWSSELETTLSSLSPSLSKTTVLQVLRLIKTPSKALQFFNWAQQMGFTHNDQSYFLMLEILGRARNLNIARNFLFSIEKKSNYTVKLGDSFFNSLIRSYGQAGLFQESMKVFTLMKSLGISPSVRSFNSLLLILLKRGRTSMAKSLFDEMLSTYGVVPDTYTFNILIRGYCKNSMVYEGFRFFKEMTEHCKCNPDVVTYNTLVDGLCRAGKVRIAYNVVKGMIKKELNPNVVTYTTLVRGYCMKQEIDDALVVFKEMLNRGLRPTDITYNTLIKGLCEVQKMDKIKEILEGALGDGGFTPDTCTFNILMNAHCKTGNWNEALRAFEKMKKLKIHPDSATYSVLIRTLCQQGNFETAEQLFDELYNKEILLSDKGCKPLVASYNTMFEFLCKNGKTNKAERVFRQLLKRGTQDAPAYKTLILGHCREGTFDDGYKLLVLMLRRDFLPDFETYELLIDGLLQKGESLLAYYTLGKMLKSSYLPKTSTFHSILAGLLRKGYIRESASFIELMLEKKVRQNVNLSTDTIRLLFTSGLRDKAFHVVGSLYDNGYLVDMKELISFLYENRRILDMQKILLFCLEKHQNVDFDMCNMAIGGLCKMKKLSEAFELYYGLVERGNHKKLSCLEALRDALEAGGRSEEAKFVSNRIVRVS